MSANDVHVNSHQKYDVHNLVPALQLFSSWKWFSGMLTNDIAHKGF